MLELIEALRYKLLRIFGVPIENATNIFCNKAVYKNTTMPESTLNKKKHHSIAYHRCCEAVAKEGTQTNLSDLFTKLLPQP